MPEVIDWRSIPDPRGAVHHVVRELRAGRVVALPTETGYHAAACGLAEAAVARLRGAGDDGEPPVVAVRGPGEARDWLPGLGRLGQRLARRSWPGPVVLKGDAGGLAGRLPEAVRVAVAPAGELGTRAPAHEIVLEILRQIAAPLLLSPASAPTAADLLQGAADGVDLVLDDGPRPAAAPTVVRVDGDCWQVVRPGAVAAETLAQRAACLVIFVCTGNTCRSPLAEALFKHRLAERVGCAVAELPARGFFVLSAGLAAMMGGAAADEAVEVARGYGADLSAHLSRPLSPDLAAQADFLVVMTRGHAEALTRHYPRLGAPPRLLSPAGEDLADPVGQALDVYRACGEQIWQHLGALLDEVAPPTPQGTEPCNR